MLCVCMCVFMYEANAPLSMSHIAVEGPDGTSRAHTFICETWYCLLQVTSPGPGEYAYTDSYSVAPSAGH